MIKELIIGWRIVEGDFADFCMDYFDDKAIEVSRVGLEGEWKEVRNEVDSNALVFFERILIAIFRYIFVKKYVITEIIENIQQKLEKINNDCTAFCGNVVNVCNTLIFGNNAKQMILQVGFT